MSDGSSIEWCDATWTIAVGCTRCSPGCDNCYAAAFVHRALHASHVGLTKVRPKDSARPGVDWNGTVRVLPHRLAEPLRWKKPRRVFVGSMTDLFHPAIAFEYISAVFGVMAATPQHTYLVLTKRPERAREFFAWLHTDNPVECCINWAVSNGVGEALDEDRPWDFAESITREPPWPLPNVHLGTSVEDQKRADERLPALLDCPAAVHWVSAEPLLGPVRMDWALWRHHLEDKPSIRWIVIGGESGPRARPFDVAWARDLMGYAVGAGCKVFVKQLGARPRDDEFSILLDDPKGGDMAQWPADLRVRELPEART